MSEVERVMLEKEMEYEMKHEDEDMQREEEEEIETDLPKFALVEISQLLKLLQRCPECDILPSGRSARKPRVIK
uniref:Uncharacterized protein n=1 Tax=Acrobeloides nanus TaxID=290746 RepID=A0A914C9Z2_9BILA